MDYLSVANELSKNFAKHLHNRTDTGFTKHELIKVLDNAMKETGIINGKVKINTNSISPPSNRINTSIDLTVANSNIPRNFVVEILDDQTTNSRQPVQFLDEFDNMVVEFNGRPIKRSRNFI